MGSTTSVRRERMPDPVRPVHEHEFEAAHGLPEPLPEGERLLWQGAPDFRAMAVRCLHVRACAGYFAAILAVRAATVWEQGGSAADGVVAVLWLAPAAVVALALLTLMAWLVAKTTAYTVTDRRVVMRVGIVLSLTFNIPLSRIESAAAVLHGSSPGDIALELAGSDRIAYLHLWPHARPWRLAKAQPMLRCVPDAARVAALLTRAWRADRGLEAAGLAVDATAASSIATLRDATPRLVRVR